ncbi:alpha-amylase [Anaeramoeba flamelloides]|uniref:Alpha-amylase n=1 Tax=Anaeramoeba flamelloides TaxID=1746091 RepID=A0ABQ8Y9L6_9EUKA|nr:alpha-amylase [Anaeramoeba flamelloides]
MKQINLLIFIFLLLTFFNSQVAGSVRDPSPGPGVVTIYYSTDFSPTTYIHYSVNGGDWTTLPGKQMDPSTNKSMPLPYHQKSITGNTLTFVFDDGKGNWDHNQGGGNYVVGQPGIYSVKNHVLKTIYLYPKKCPGNPTCSNHGTCNNGNCVCKSGYYSEDCSKYCDPYTHIVCDDGKTCVSGKTCPIQPLPGCQTYHDGKCTGDTIVMPPSFKARRWQTPTKGSGGHRDSFQDYSHLVGWNHVVYSSDHQSATLEVKATHKDGASLKYSFNGGSQTSSNTKQFTSSFTDVLTVTVYGSDGTKLVLPEYDFMWNTHTPIQHTSGDYRDGQKGAIVSLFGWPDGDIEKECEMLGKAGYLGVKLFPHQESLASIEPMSNILNPWYFYYQPVSYQQNGRHGTRATLRQLIATCRSHNVRIYSDTVLNHMTGSGNDMQKHRNDAGSCVYWPGKNSTGGDNMSPFFTQGFTYIPNENTELPPSQEYPGVPYGPLDFHCERALNSWTDPLDLNAGWLVGLVDINTERDNVQERMADYLTDLIGLGISGFRIDAAKHIKPDDLISIFTKFKRNMGGNIPKDFITWWEVLLGGEKDLLMCNTNSGYNFGKYIENGLDGNGFSTDDINKIKIWWSSFPNAPSPCGGVISRVRQVIENDDHDQQFGGSSRDMHGKGVILVKDRDVSGHRFFEKKLFSGPEGVSDNNNDWPIRLLLSSYYFPNNDAQLGAGIPDGNSDCSKCKVQCDTCKNVAKTSAYQPNKCGYTGPVYTRTHRDKDIIMAMRGWMGLDTSVSNSDIGIPDSC